MFLLFGGVAVVSWIVQSPSVLTLHNFGFGDLGANFTLAYLASRGLRPEVDFGYHYGLLSLLLGRLLFRFFGYTPGAYEVANLITLGFISWAFATIASCEKFKWPAVTLTVVAMPIAVPPVYPNLAHCAEAVLISFGLAQHAQGNRASALACATAACFAKPVMGYVYGLLLLVLILRQSLLSASSAFAMLRAIVPAIVTAIALALATVYSFGLEASILALLPLRGVAAYRAAGFGFFNHAGRDFWHPQHARIAYYLGTPIGFWFLATIWIMWRGSLSAIRLMRDRDNDTRTELIACIAAMQAVFILFMFGSTWSWWYYSYFLVIGAAISIASAGAAVPAIAGALIMLSLFVARGFLKAAWIAYSTTQASPQTAGLRASEAERREWNAVLDLARGHRSVVVPDDGGAALIFPQFDKPEVAFMVPALMLPGDTQREAAQLARAQVIVRHKLIPGQWDCFGKNAELQSAMRGARVVLDGDYFTVFERPAPAKK